MNDINNLMINFRFKTGDKISFGERGDSFDEITVTIPENTIKNFIGKIREDATSKPKVFDSVCNETVKNPETNHCYTISALCDENGCFEVMASGDGGADVAKQAVERILELVEK